MNITIDVGNTSTKVAIFENNTLLKIIEKVEDADLLHLVNEEYKGSSIAISAVRSGWEKVVADFKGVKKIIVLNSKTLLPLQNKYESPETLGVDRLAVVIGAKAKFPSHACLAIDAGTCITYDFIDKENNYLGGSISPGIQLRFKALNQFTARLPLVERKESFDLIGTNTQDAIRSGVLEGVVAEVNGIISRYQDKFSDLKLLICGGDAKFFESKIKQSIFVVPELVLIGLNRIIEYNNDKEV